MISIGKLNIYHQGDCLNHILFKNQQIITKKMGCEGGDCKSYWKN